jgi:Flp pilus assembly protein TadB/Mg-chelatase subunit ChlD
MRCRRLLTCVLALITALTVTASAGAAPLSASFGSAAPFPSRVLIVSAPAGYPVTAGTLHVREDGTRVRGLSVTPLSAAHKGDFGVILVVDTSESMKGAPLGQAMLAARTLAAERTGNQALGVLEFNHSISPVLPLTSSTPEISAALSKTPVLGGGTRIYDATETAIQQLHDAGVAASTVVVLSDGADLGSKQTQQSVAASAAANHVRVYTVGVKDRSFTPRTLTSLANATHGSYTASDGAGLRTVFTRIESELTDRYLVKYRSGQGLDEKVQVRVSVDGISKTWTGIYATPPYSHAAASEAKGHGAKPPFWTSTLALVAVTLICATLLVGGLFTHLVRPMRRHRLRRRIAEFTTVGIETHERDAQRTGGAGVGPAGVAGGIDRWLGRFALWAPFKEDVDVAAMQRSPADLVLLTGLVTLTVAVLAALLIGSALIAMPVLLVGPAVLIGVVRHKASRQRLLFSEQLPGHLEAVGSAMRAGHSVFAAIAAMAEDAVDPTRREFDRAVADERLGVSVDEALRPIARRMRSPDVEQLALVAALNQRTGGNMSEVLDLIADAARERADLRRELRALTAQARMSKVVVTALPVGLLAILTLINPSYEAPLFTTPGGIVVLCLAAGLVCAGWFVMGMLVPSEE